MRQKDYSRPRLVRLSPDALQLILAEMKPQETWSETIERIFAGYRKVKLSETLKAASMPEGEREIGSSISSS